MKRTSLVAICLALLTAAIFSGVSRLQFLNYDDPDYITLNPIVQKGLSSEGLAWAFGKIHGQETYWHPITWVSHMLDVEFFGLNPRGHHLVSLAFHIANVVLLFLLLKGATGAFWRSALVAALFAVHPLQVESVAWVTERKNVLSTFFWMLTLWFYVAYAKTPGTGRYLASVGAFAIGLMCKPALVPLPGVLLLLDYWPLRRLGVGSKRPLAIPASHGSATGSQKPEQTSALSAQNQVPLKKILLEKVPFFALAIVSALITLSAHRGLGMLDEASKPPRSLQFGNIFVSYFRYLRKTLWPSDLAVFYPFPTSLDSDLVAGSIGVLLVITAWVLWQNKRRPYLAVGWFWFLGVLVPTIGIVRVGIQAMADRFIYVPIIGLFIAAVWGVADLLERRRVSVKAASVVGILAIAIFLPATIRQVTYWKNDSTIFEHARVVTKDNYLAYTAVGGILCREGKYEEGMNYLDIAQHICPTFPDVYYSIGVALLLRGNGADAAANLAEALRLKPKYREARLNFAVALQMIGRLDESIENYRLFLDAEPNSVKGQIGLGNALMTKGRAKEAVEHFRAALQLDPQSAGAMARLAWILSTHKDAAVRNGPEAVRLSEQACRLTNTNDVQTVNTLGAAYAEVGQFDLAIRMADQALEMAKTRRQSNLLPVIQGLRDLYAKKQPYRETGE